MFPCYECLNVFVDNNTSREYGCHTSGQLCHDAAAALCSITFHCTLLLTNNSDLSWAIRLVCSVTFVKQLDYLIKSLLDFTSEIYCVVLCFMLFHDWMSVFQQLHCIQVMNERPASRQENLVTRQPVYKHWRSYLLPLLYHVSANHQICVTLYNIAVFIDTISN